MKIPKKKELLELQRKYRTDKKIGEVYGVPARLVAYWRSKKRIGPYSSPKYSEEKIQELWDRFGNDEKAGAELNISKAGFRQWRRKYGINQRPAHLKLEQLELPLPDFNRRKSSRRETIAQKILARKSGLKRVEVGEIITIEPDLVVADSRVYEAVSHLRQIGGERIADPSKTVIVLDQREAVDDGNGLPPHRAIREFARKQKIRAFYDIGQGVCHQLILENAHVIPGQLVLTSDPYGLSYGAIAALAAQLSPAEIAVVWASGRIWLRVPETIKVVLAGRMGRGVSARDVILKIGRELAPEANYRAAEFYGPVIDAMSVSDRLTLAGAAADLGFKTVIVPFDDVTGRFLRKIIKTKYATPAVDPDASYCHEAEFDIEYLTPQVGSAHDTYLSHPVEEFVGKRLDQVVIGCCANGRIDDLEAAARILRGRQINRDVRAIVIPGSRKIYLEALERGFVRIFLDSGCIVMNPGCGSCLEAHRRMLAEGERAISTACDKCPGHRGAAETEIFMASPVTAASSALEGAIADPRKYIK